MSRDALRQEVEAFTDKIYTCVIPRDLHYIRERARRRGDTSVSALAAFLGKALNITPVIFGRPRRRGITEPHAFNDFQ